MDPITQALLGACASQTVYAKKLKKHAAILGGLTAMSPDLDVLIRSSHNPTLFFIYHRGFSHSLLFIPIGGIICALIYLLFVKSMRCQWHHIIFAAIIAYATHGILDATTTYGTELFWPFSHYRVALDYMSIIDPIYSIILFIGVILALRKSSIKPAIIALIVSTLYIGFGAYQHHRAYDAQLKLMTQRGQIATAGRLMPNLGNLLSFRSIYLYKNKIYSDTVYTPLFKSAYSKKGNQYLYAKIEDFPVKIQQQTTWMDDFKIFKWFCQGYVVIFSKKPLIVADARYIFPWTPDTALWGIRFPKNIAQQHVYFQRQVSATSDR